MFEIHLYIYTFYDITAEDNLFSLLKGGDVCAIKLLSEVIRCVFPLSGIFYKYESVSEVPIVPEILSLTKILLVQYYCTVYFIFLLRRVECGSAAFSLCHCHESADCWAPLG